jgi:hypothetical protein
MSTRRPHDPEIVHRKRAGRRHVRVMEPYRRRAQRGVGDRRRSDGGGRRRWRLGLKQSSLGHIARVLRRGALDASRRPPLSRHAMVPSRFRVQVSQARTSLQFLPTALGIQRSATRRTAGIHVTKACLTRWFGGPAPISGLAGASGAGDNTPRIMRATGGGESCRARRPGTPLRGRLNGNGVTQVG